MPATYEPIASITLGSDSTPSFTNIPSTYTDLVLLMSLRSANAASDRYFGLRFNSDSGTTYSLTTLSGNGTAASSYRESNFSRLLSNGIPGNGATSGVFGAVTIHIMSYANTNVFKTVLASTADSRHADYSVTRSVALWRSTSAITSIEVSDYGVTSALKTGSVLSLYGIKAA
jgi:hypothetical protein